MEMIINDKIKIVTENDKIYVQLETDLYYHKIEVSREQAQNIYLSTEVAMFTEMPQKKLPLALFTQTEIETIHAKHAPYL